MPDAVTHLAGGRLLGALWTPERRVLLYIGAILPDLVEKGLRVLFSSSHYFAMPAHSVLGATLVCAALCTLFDGRVRRDAFGLLWIGSMLHLALDLLKDPGEGLGVPALYPFVKEGFGLGLFRSEDSLLLVPVSLAVIGLMEWRARR